MLNYLYSYIQAFAHPFRYHNYLRSHTPLPGLEFDQLRKNSLSDTILCSWLFFILRGVTELTMLYFVGSIFLSLMESIPEEFRYLLFDRVETQRFLVFFIVFRVVFFPVMIGFKVVFRRWFYYVMSLFFSDSRQENLDQKIDDVINVSLVSFLPGFVPIFGDLLQIVSEYVLLFAGYRESFGLGKFQSFILLFFPQIFMSFLFITALIILLCIRVFFV